MKKIGIFGLVGCLLTVGGVYAQWTYGQATAGSVSESIIPQMAGVGQSSKKGTIGLVTSGVQMVIDAAGTGEYVYHPVLRITGDVTITFTASDGADAEVKASGIKMGYYITKAADWKYDGNFDGDLADAEDKEIFSLLDCGTPEAPIALNGGAPCKSASIDAATLAAKISLNVEADFELDTKAKYDSFKNHLNKEKSLFTVAVVEMA